MISALVAAGWTRVSDPAWRTSCGMPGPTSGYCERNARWKEHPGARAMCAQHAYELVMRAKYAHAREALGLPR
jgi:hypothetical protein